MHISSSRAVRSLLTTPLIALLSFISGCDSAQAPNQSLEVAVKGLYSAALSDDGTLAVVGSITHGGSFWRLETNERLYNWNHSSEETSTIVVSDISPDNNFALTADPATLVLWDTQTGQGLRYWTAPGEILSAKLSPNARTALLGLSDHSAVLFDIQRGGVIHTFKHGNRVRSVDLSRNGRLALTGSEDGTSILWDVASGKELARHKFDAEVKLVKLSPDGSLALSMSKFDRALLWRTRSGEALGEIPLGSERLKRGISFSTANFSRDNRLLLTGRPDQVVQLWDLASLTEITRWKMPKRSAWKPTSTAVLAVSFGENEGEYNAIASNGFIHQLKLAETPP